MARSAEGWIVSHRTSYGAVDFTFLSACNTRVMKLIYTTTTMTHCIRVGEPPSDPKNVICASLDRSGGSEQHDNELLFTKVSGGDRIVVHLTTLEKTITVVPKLGTEHKTNDCGWDITPLRLPGLVFNLVNRNNIDNFSIYSLTGMKELHPVSPIV